MTNTMEDRTHTDEAEKGGGDGGGAGEGEAQRNVYPLDWDHQGLDGEELRSLLGGKGAGLNEMTRLGLPVPPGFTITTEGVKKNLFDINPEIKSAMKALERQTNRFFWDEETNGRLPLLVSVRSGAKVSMPGMMDTVLNVGLTENKLEQMREHYGESLFNAFRGTYIPQGLEWYDPLSWIKRVADSWNSHRARSYRRQEGISDDMGTAITVQMMVYGNLNDRSGTGVAFTRNPNTGERVPYGDFLLNAQGEDVVNGKHETMRLDDMRLILPEAYNRLLSAFEILENHYHDMCDVEFTVEDGELYILQTRIGKRTPQATTRILVEMVSEGLVQREEALLRVTENDLADPPAVTLVNTAEPIAHGLPASPGIVVGKLCFDSKKIAEMKKEGDAVIYCAETTSPEDVKAFIDADAILTMKGGLVSHAAVVARGWNKPCIVGAGGQVGTLGLGLGPSSPLLGHASIITLDGSTGNIYLGEVERVFSDGANQYRDTILEWADDIRGEHPILTRADFASEIEKCDADPIYANTDRPLLRYTTELCASILDDSPLDIFAALRRDYREIIQAAGQRELYISLCNEKPGAYMTLLSDLRVKREIYGLAQVEKAEMAFLTSDRAIWRPEGMNNLAPGLWDQQIRAIIEAVIDNSKGGKKPRVRILIPGLDRPDTYLSWCDRIARVGTEIGAARHKKITITTGILINTPAGLARLEEFPPIDVVLIDTADIRRRLGASDDTLITGWLPRRDDDPNEMACSILNDFIINPYTRRPLATWWYLSEIDPQRLARAQQILSERV